MTHHQKPLPKWYSVDGMLSAWGKVTQQVGVAAHFHELLTFSMFPKAPNSSLDNPGTVAMAAALCAPPSAFFHAKIPLPTIAATPETQSSPCKCVTFMKILGTAAVRNHQSPSTGSKLVTQRQKETQPYIFFSAQNLRRRRIVQSRDALVTRTPRCPTLTALWRWVLSVSIAATIYSLPWPNNFAMARTATLEQDCENVSLYYNQASELKGEKLKQKLQKIVAGHQSLSYAQVWNALKILDAADGETPETSPDIVEIYSLKRIPKLLAGRSAGWNREHLWPRSYGLMEGQPEFSDLHNLRPADVNVNSSRGNKYFGDCTVLKTMHCLVPANHEAAPDTATDAKTWRPPSQVRGDIARALFYMAVRYGSEQPPGRFGLQLSDSPSPANARMGLLSTLLQWNNMDPPSASEALRNSRVCSLFQHNRNPFVDHPEYAASIWGASDVVNKSQVAEIADDMPAMRGPVHMQQQVNAWINEIHYNNKGRDQDEFVEVVAGPGYDKASLSLFLYDRQGKVYNTISLADVGSLTYSQDGSEYLVCSATFPAGSIQNGPGDGIALVQDQAELNREVLQFLSYQGVLTATEGPAIGLVSTDIGVRESNNYPIGSSLGLTGSGGHYSDFKWTQLSRAASPGRLNPGQFITKKIQLSKGMEEGKQHR